MKKATCLTALILLVVVSVAGAEEKKLGISTDFKYMSKYMSKGTEAFGQQPGVFVTTKFDFWDTGFGIGVGHQNATNSGYVNKQRFNYLIYYGNTAFEDSQCQMDYQVTWIYKHYYDQPRDAGNTQNYLLSISWPNLLNCENLFPYYIADYETPAGSGYDNRSKAGWVHTFGLGYDVDCEKFPSPLRFTGDISYRDGYGGGNVDHDWSHARLGVSTKFKIDETTSFHPAVYQQVSMDDSVAKRDVTYAVISLKKKFK
ncbi:MAG: hypothetical protein ACYS8Z_04920 [Planctomycetota bacterium]|jgi:hypothetical protein